MVYTYIFQIITTANMGHSPNVGRILGQRRKLCYNNNQTSLCQLIVFALTPDKSAEIIVSILWNSIALISNIFTELANTMMYGSMGLYNFVFNKLPFKTVSSDVNAFHRIATILFVCSRYIIKIAFTGNTV